MSSIACMYVCVSGEGGANLEAEECGHAERGGLSPPHTHLGPPAGAGAAPVCAQRTLRAPTLLFSSVITLSGLRDVSKFIE